MTPDLAIELINATVQIEQPAGAGQRTVGTGFLVSAPGPTGAPRTVLVTAAHVLKKMPMAEVKIGYRTSVAGGDWRFTPQMLTVREGEAPLFVQHPTRDIAVMSVVAPPEFAKAAIPLAWLADQGGAETSSLGPGDELFALGFPRGLSANKAGFPILRAGRVASYPIAPSSSYPTFLLDFAVFAGNSGGPVFRAGAERGAVAGQAPQGGFIAGVLTQQVELKNDRLEIGIVTHAAYVREAIALLDGEAAPAAAALLTSNTVEGAEDAVSVEDAGD
jgi:S1-C subfamily serine protease